MATEALATEPGHQKIMVLLTDGEDLEGQGLDEAKRASAAGVTIDTVGVGTLAGELVPAKDARGATSASRATRPETRCGRGSTKPGSRRSPRRPTVRIARSVRTVEGSIVSTTNRSPG